jgi:hypothetical protein
MAHRRNLRRVEGGVSIPAIVRIEGAERRLVIYTRTGEVAWDFPLSEFLAALREAESSLADYPS